MMYKNPGQQTRHLQRLWRVRVYVGNPNAKKPRTRAETIIAWNAVDAVRKAGGPVAKPPVDLGFVTWSREGETERYHIETTAGPTNKKVKPSIETEEVVDWGF